MTTRRLAVLLVLATTASAATAADAEAVTAPYVLLGDRNVGGVLIARADLDDARARFGAPSTARRAASAHCVATWRRLGLTLAFLDLSGGAPCRGGVLVRATITSRGAWRTARELRKGDSVARLRRLYPEATYRRHAAGLGWTGWWLVTRRACELGGYEPYPGLLARVRDGRVAALVAATTACE